MKIEFERVVIADCEAQTLKRYLALIEDAPPGWSSVLAHRHGSYAYIEACHPRTRARSLGHYSRIQRSQELPLFHPNG